MTNRAVEPDPTEEVHHDHDREVPADRAHACARDPVSASSISVASAPK
jgi:hypothetical protein